MVSSGLYSINLVWREATVDAEWQQRGWGHEQEGDGGGLTQAGLKKKRSLEVVAFMLVFSQLFLS